MPLPILPSFARGELDPALHGRVDTAIYHTGVAVARNTQVSSSGGIVNRPGRKFIGPVKDHSRQTRLIPFSFTDDDTYILEFGHEYIRVIREDGHVLTGSTIINITGATQADPVIVTTSGNHSLSANDHVFINGVLGMKQLNERFFEVRNLGAATAELFDQVTGLSVDGTGFGAYSSAGALGALFTLTTPYQEVDLPNLKFVQSADVMTLTHPAYDAKELRRMDHDDWSLVSVTFVPDHDAPQNVDATQNGIVGSAVYRYKVTAEALDGAEESLAGIRLSGDAITGATQANPVVVSSILKLSNGDSVFIEDVAGMTEINDRIFVSQNVVSGVSFELTGEDGTGHTAYTSGGTAIVTRSAIITGATQADPVVVSSVLKLSDGERVFIAGVVGMTQINDRTFIARNVDNGVSFELEDENGTGHTAYVSGGTATVMLSVIVTGATQADPVVISSALALTEGDEVFVSGVVGMMEINDRAFIARNVSSGVSFELESEDGTEHSAYVSGGTAELMYAEVTDGNATLSETNSIDTTWDAVPGTSRYAVYKQENGLYGFIAETEVQSFTDEGTINPDFNLSHPKPRNPFSGPNKRPGAVGLYEQRRVLGGSNNRPDVSVFSVTGSLSNLSVSSPLKATDAITARLTALEKSQIRHYIPLNDLLVLTSGQEFEVDAGENVSFAFDTIRQRSQSNWGAAQVRPAVIGDVILFVQANKKVVRSLKFQFSTDKYASSDLSLLSRHLFRDWTIVDFAHAKAADDIVVAVRSDGKVAQLTFQEEQQVVAWSLWDTPGGKDESAAAVQPSLGDPKEAVYFACQRTIGGSVVRYIERVTDRNFVDVRDAFFVDSAATHDDPKVVSGATSANPVVVTVTGHPFLNGDQVDLSDIEWEPDEDEFGDDVQPDQLNDGRFVVRNSTANTFELEDLLGNPVDGSSFNAYVEGGRARLVVSDVTGLWHLEGKTVVGLIDGNVVKNLTVTDGEVTPARAFSRAHVGLSYLSDVETLNIEPQAQEQTIQGREKHVVEVTIRFNRSRGIWVGPNKNDLVEMAQREFERYGEPTKLLTGDKSIILPPDWNSEGRVFMRQRDPLPMEILAVLPRFELEDT